MCVYVRLFVRLQGHSASHCAKVNKLRNRRQLSRARIEYLFNEIIKRIERRQLDDKLKIPSPLVIYLFTHRSTCILPKKKKEKEEQKRKFLAINLSPPSTFLIILPLNAVPRVRI